MAKPAPKTKRMTPEEQLQRFKDTAIEVGADESPDALKRAFRQIDPKKHPNKELKRS